MIKDYSTSKFLNKICAIALLVMLSATVIGQTTITGIVTSGADKLSLPGVNIVIKGTSVGTVTDFDGKYSVEVPGSDAILVFSMMGMLTEEVTVGSQKTIDMVMNEDLIGIDEVVVVGYGTMKKSDITGSIVSMKEEQMTETKSHNVLESLQGKAAGVDITRSSGRTGAGIDIKIRGDRTLAGSNDPLIIVDGIPYGSDISIDPNDIESLEILKDVSSTAIYGSRGANGVILITTKKGTKNASKVFFNTYYGFTQPYQKVPVFDRDGYIKAKIDANRDITDWATDPNMTNVFPGDELTGYEDGTSTDWQDLVTRNGYRQNYHLGFMGGTEKFIYNTSISYFNEKGVTVADEFDQLTFRLNVESEINKYVKVGSASTLSYKVRDGRGPRFTDALLGSPICPAYDSVGDYIYQPNFANPRKSPLAQTYDKRQEIRTKLISSFFAEINFTNDLSFRSSMGVNMNFDRNGYMYPQKVENEGNTQSGVDMQYDYDYTWTNLLNYTKKLGLNTVNLTLGQESFKSNDQDYTMYGINQDYERSLWYNLTTNKEQQTTSNLEERSMLSYFGRINYNYDNKYMVNVTGRYDGASQLAEGNKWSFFPSIGGAWRISGEDFMTAVPQVNDLKLRVAYGVSGNSSVDPYSTSAALNSNPLYMQFGEPGSETTYFGYRPVSLASKTLKWETTKSTNVGFDIGLFDNRVVANVDAFVSHTYDLLLNDKLPLSSGFFYVTTNAGETKGKGIELNLSTVNVDIAGFKWTSSLTFSKVETEIVALTSGIDQDLGNEWFVGQPINVIYDYEMAGIWQLDEEAEALANASEVGYIKVNDTNADDTINTDDRIILGQRDPKWTGSFSNTFSYKGWDLTVNMYARMGHMIDASAYSFDPRMYDNQLEINYWTPENPTNDYPRLNASVAELDYENLLRYKDGSFIKLKNITLGYNFPKKWIEPVHISSLRAYFTTNNPFILYTKLDKGIDPENGGGFSWPMARSFIFGLNLQF